MPITTSDRLQITETLALQAHIVDQNQLDRLEELFTPDAVYDMRASGMGAFEGLQTIRAAASRLAASGVAPVAHFVTNVVITDDGDQIGDHDGDPDGEQTGDEGQGRVTTRSKGLMVMHDGSLHTVVYDDVLRLHGGRWLISRRVITPAGTAPASAPTSVATPVPASRAH